MAGSYEERRSGRDRRRSRGQAEETTRVRGADRRQFPPPEDPARVTEGESELRAAIDAHKLERGLTRISVSELLGVMETLGYRRA
ncbi:MAG TPA: hypothetical protein VFH53_03425 [Phycisphaerae bacterium]|nr:hypothetical protein [Phycisphaerae bacterium]HUX16010.1 hypothetical protein [Phycisphaerae bacterium]